MRGYVTRLTISLVNLYTWPNCSAQKHVLLTVYRDFLFSVVIAHLNIFTVNPFLLQLWRLPRDPAFVPVCGHPVHPRRQPLDPCRQTSRLHQLTHRLPPVDTGSGAQRISTFQKQHERRETWTSVFFLLVGFYVIFVLLFNVFVCIFISNHSIFLVFCLSFWVLFIGHHKSNSGVCTCL